MKITFEQLYNRQIKLSEIGEKGQNKLAKAKVIVVGCGGLGSAAAVYLAASGIGFIHLVDYDIVDASNLPRQVFYRTEDIGRSKAEVLKDHILAISPFVKVSFGKNAIVKSNVLTEIQPYDFILDCTDSLPSKYLLNDACVIQNKPMIYGSLYKYDGYVASFNVTTHNDTHSSNLRDAFPEISKEAIPNCSEVGTLNIIVGVIGMLQANEVLKIVMNVGNPLLDQLLIYNSLDNSQYKMILKRSISKKQVEQIFEKESYSDVACVLQDERLLISSKELKKELSKHKNLKIISVVEDSDICLPFKSDDNIPFSKFNIEKVQLSPNNEYVIVCNRGVTSYTVTLLLKEKYPNVKILSLKNGITNY